MKGLLGTAADEEDEALSLMWEDGLAECVCPLGNITFDDFRMFVKGQKREKEPSSPIPRRTSHRFSLEMSPLQAVPEGSMSPQAKHQVFAKFAEMSALESMKLPVLGAPLVPILPFNKEVADLTFPRNVPTPLVKRTRSRSLGETPTPEYLTQERLEMQPWASTNALPCAALPNKSGGKLREGLMDESRSTREIHQALYQKHRQFRQSVTIASKLFDQKQKARKFEAALVTYEVGHDLERRASLVMKRGASPIFPKKGAFMGAKSEHFSINHGQESAVPRPTDPSPDDSDHGRKVADASKRSGRPRRPREKTASDISGMLR